MPEERLTKDQRREAAREAARIAREKQKKRETVNSILLRGGVTVGILAIAAVIALAIYTSVRPAGPGPLNMASDGIVLQGADMGVVPTAATPADAEPTPTDTAELGTDVHIQLYVDYLCPFCQAFDLTNAPLIETLVTSGQASVEIHPVSILDRASAGSRYASRAANAMACVAENEPDSFWAAHTAMFENQPAESTTGLDNGEIIGVLEGAGVTSAAVADCVNAESFRSWVTAATDRVLADESLANPASGGFGTPTVFVNGERYTGAVDDATAFQSFVLSLLPVAETPVEGETTE